MNQADAVLLVFETVERTFGQPARTLDLQAVIRSAFDTERPGFEISKEVRRLLEPYRDDASELFLALDYLQRQGLLSEFGSAFALTDHGRERLHDLGDQRFAAARLFEKEAAVLKWGELLDDEDVPRYHYHSELVAHIKEMTPESLLLHRALDQGNLSALAHLKAWAHAHLREVREDSLLKVSLDIYTRALEGAAIGISLTLEDRYRGRLKREDAALLESVRSGS